MKGGHLSGSCSLVDILYDGSASDLDNVIYHKVQIFLSFYKCLSTQTAENC